MFRTTLGSRLTTPVQSLMAPATFRTFGGAIVKADGTHQFIAPCNKKTMVFDGLRPTANLTHEVTNNYRHQNDLPLYNHVHPFSSYAGGHTWEEEHNIHDLPYGYEVGDDPFDATGNGDYPYLLIFVAAIAFVHFSHAHFYFHKRHTGEVLYHQRLTALQIEDEIRARRKPNMQ